MKKDIIRLSEIESVIITLREQQVILDKDVAALYGVETKHINQAVRNNPDKFPERYLFKLTAAETEVLRSKILTLKPQDGEDLRGKHSKYVPTAFTESGLYMLATILKGERAVHTTIAIIDTFAKLRQLTRTINEIAATTDKEKYTTLMQKSGDIVADILGEDLHTTDTETEIELNLAVLKFKHTIKRRKENE